MTEELKILIFLLDNQCFAVDIKDVERILNYEAPTKIPESLTFLEGVINYGNEIIPIINMGKKFNKSNFKTIENSSIIVTRDEDKPIGFIVDSVSEVRSINKGQMEDLPEISVNSMSKYIKGLIKDKINNNIIILLDFKKILSEEEKKKI